MSEKENIREIILIGRGPESNFVADDASVSRQHAQIIDYGTYYTVVDLGSTNGTSVNGRRVTSETTLHAGDVLKVGNVVVPWEQIVQPPQKQKKAKVLLAILIPVIAVLLIGIAVAGYFIYRNGKKNIKVEEEQTEMFNNYAKQIDENNKTTRLLEEEQKEKLKLEEQKKAIDAEKEAAIRAKAEAEREKEQAKKDAEQAKEEAKQAQAEVAKLKQEEQAKKEEEQVKKVKAKKAEEEEQEKKVKAKKAKDAEELKRTYNALKDSIGRLDINEAKNVCKALGMNEAANGAWPKPELLKEAERAFKAEDSARLVEIEKAVKNKK